MQRQESEVPGGRLPGRFATRLVVTAMAGVGVFVVLAIYADVKEVARNFADFRWEYLPLIVLLILSSYILRFCKWHYFLGRIGVRLRVKDSLMIFLSGLTMAVTPARLGEVSKSYLLKRANGTEISRSVPVVFAERITDLLGMLTLAAISFSAFEYGRVFLIAVLAFLLALVVVLRSRRASGILLWVAGSVPLLRRLSGSIEVALGSARTLMGFRNLVVATGISIVAAGVQCLAMYFVLRAFGTDASVLLSTFVFSFSSLAGSVSMIPGGLVAAEGSLTGLLVLADISKVDAAGATMVIRICTLWLGIAIGLVATLRIRNAVFQNPPERPRL